MLEGVGDLEPPALKEDLQAPDEVSFRDTPVVPALLALRIAAGYGDRIEGEGALPEHVHDGRPRARGVHAQGSLAAQLGGFHERTHPLGDVRVEQIPKSLQ